MRYTDTEHFKSICGYTINDIWYPRVTKILDVKSKPGLENFLREVGDYSSAQDVKDKSAAEGTVTHHIVQKLAVGENIEIPEEVRPAAQAFLKFQEERKIFFHKDFIEKQIWSIRHRYAGTVDALATIDGKFGVLDIKTSNGFYPEYNLQTAAYASALQEYQIKKTLSLPQDISTRWILRVTQQQICGACGAVLRKKGGRSKIRVKGANSCSEDGHDWGELKGEVELREFPYFYKDIRAFVAAKVLWEWEYDYWLKKIGYIK